MEEKIIEILQDCKNGISVEICKDALLNLCGVSQRSELLPEFLMEDLDGKIITSVIGSSDVTKEWNNYLSNCV